MSNFLTYATGSVALPNASNTTSPTATFGTNNTAGSLLIATVISDGTAAEVGTISVAHDSLGNIWTQVGTQQSVSGVAYGATFICAGGIGGANTITFNLTGTGFCTVQMNLVEYTGQFATNPLSASALSIFASSSGPFANNLTTVDVNEQVIQILVTRTGSNWTPTATGWNEVFHGAGNIVLCDIGEATAGSDPSISILPDRSNSAVLLTLMSFKSTQSQAATPVASPVAGTYTSTQSVTLTSATGGAAIYYTTDGTTPTSGSTLYSGAISISATTTLNAIAILATYVNSAIFSGVYTINSGGGIGIVKTSGAATPATVANSSGFSWPITSPTTSGKVGQPTPVVFCDPNGNEYTVTGSTKGGQIGAATPVCLCTSLGVPITPTIQLTSNGNSINITATKTGVNRGRPIPVILTDLNGFAYVLTAFSTFGSYMSNPTPICLTDVNGKVLTLLVAA